MRKVGWQDRTQGRIIIYKQEHPFATLQSIGDYFGVSKPYIYKVLKQNGESTRRQFNKKKAYYCIQCNAYIMKPRRFCSDECSFHYRNIKVNCAVCHVPFYRKRYNIKYQASQGCTYIFCSRKCMYKRSQITLT